MYRREVLLGSTNIVKWTIQSTQNLILRPNFGKSACWLKKTPSLFVAKHPLLLHQNTLPFWGKTPSPFQQKVAVVYQNRAVVCQKEGMVLKTRTSQRQYMKTALRQLRQYYYHNVAYKDYYLLLIEHGRLQPKKQKYFKKKNTQRCDQTNEVQCLYQLFQA